MAASPPKPPPPTFAVGSSSPKPPPPFPGHLSDVELIDSYLRPRVDSGTEVGFIHEADVYSDYPDLLTRNHAAATSSNGERAWYFFTTLASKGPSNKRMKRGVDTGSGREGTWSSDGRVYNVVSNDQRLVGRRRSFAYKEKMGGNRVKSAWRMMELSLVSDEGGQEEVNKDLLVLCKVYRDPNAKAEDGSSMAAAKAEAEAPAVSTALTLGREGADEEIGAETAAAPVPAVSTALTLGREGADEEIGAETAAAPVRKKRKAGDKDSAAETVASSHGRLNKAGGEIDSADAATIGQIFADKDPLDAAEEAEQEEPRDPRDPLFYNFFPDSQNPKRVIGEP